MKNWGRRHNLVAGLALVLATNAVVLAGVAYNRSGEPDAVLRLTEREFLPERTWGFHAENSGLALRLNWRVRRGSEDEAVPDYGYGGYGGPARWLDRTKLAELGFDVSTMPEEPVTGRYYDKHLPREVLLVMEFNGATYQAALKGAEDRAGRATATQHDAAQIAGERNTYSRLFVVDAGLDEAALRAKYPDRTRYAIARGKVGVGLHYGLAGSTPRIGGYVGEVSVAELQVPKVLRDVIGRGQRFEAGVSFGRRLEPWLTSATPRQQ